MPKPKLIKTKGNDSPLPTSTNRHNPDNVLCLPQKSEFLSDVLLSKDGAVYHPTDTMINSEQKHIEDINIKEQPVIHAIGLHECNGFLVDVRKVKFKTVLRRRSFKILEKIFVKIDNRTDSAKKVEENSVNNTKDSIGDVLNVIKTKAKVSKSAF